MAHERFINPYTPGAGHMPHYLAGREQEKQEFARLLTQETVMENLVISGLRGVGKTVLLESLKPIAIEARWLWAGADLSESASLSETNLAVRMIADLALVTSSISIGHIPNRVPGFAPGQNVDVRLDFNFLSEVYNKTPGLSSDKLKAVLEMIAVAIEGSEIRGVVFAYDEAQNMMDHPEKQQYPLSLMLEVFQSIQRKGIPFMLVFTGLPTLMPKLIEARTYSERMFHTRMLDRLQAEDCRAAILKPIQDSNCPVKFSEAGINAIIKASGGYPYFIQFLCRELYDAYLQTDGQGIAVAEAVRKLDSDFFLARWSRATDRQKQLLWVVANLVHCDGEFSVQDVANRSKQLLPKPFSASHITQMFHALSDAQLVYKNRHGRYSFAVPLLGPFILRQAESPQDWSPPPR